MFFVHFLLDFPEPYNWKEHWEIIWANHPMKAFYNIYFMDW